MPYPQNKAAWGKVVVTLLSHVSSSTALIEDKTPLIVFHNAPVGTTWKAKAFLEREFWYVKRLCVSSYQPCRKGMPTLSSRVLLIVTMMPWSQTNHAVISNVSSSKQQGALWVGSSRPLTL